MFLFLCIHKDFEFPKHNTRGCLSKLWNSKFSSSSTFKSQREHFYFSKPFSKNPRYVASASCSKIFLCITATLH